MATTHRNPSNNPAHPDSSSNYPPAPYDPTAPSMASYPPPPQQQPTSYAHSNKSQQHISFDPAKQPQDRPAPSQQTSSWDILGGIKSDYEKFDPSNAREPHLKYAPGDAPKTGVMKLYHYLLNFSIITRWALFIVPVLGVIWIPGILGYTIKPNATVWTVHLKWWSIWLSIVWGGWWAAVATFRLLPVLLRWTLGNISRASLKYIQWASLLHRYIALLGWTIAIWVSWIPIITNHSDKTKERSQKSLQFISRLLFGFLICAAVLLAEKIGIQWVAYAFHRRSYADRIEEQKQARKVLVTLYEHSTEMPDRGDTLQDGPVQAKAGSVVDPRWLLKAALKGVREVATTTTTAFGNVASEIAGSSVLLPNSPPAMVAAALASANKSRLLARRLFYSFRTSGSSVVYLNDIAPFFKTPEEAAAAFIIFDKDGNGDCTRDEFETACLECHREQLALANSMKDIDSAVGRLDNILMSVYVVIAGLIIAVALEAEISTIITGAGALILGLSWLIGGSLQEVLGSIIFTFIKHPYDVGDRVKIGGNGFTVKEIRLLSTIFLDTEGCQVQAPNVMLNGQFIYNMRRSQNMSESFTWDVAFGTTFEEIEALRSKMLAFVKTEKRDFLPSFDIVVQDFAEQGKLSLKADIKYKSNCQIAPLKAKRRNMWVCALKTAMSELKIYGPSGNPNAPPDTKQVTLVPWETIQGAKKEESEEVKEAGVPRGKWQLSDKNTVMVDPAQDVFGETDDLYLTRPRAEAGPSAGAAPAHPTRADPARDIPSAFRAPEVPSGAARRE